MKPETEHIVENDILTATLTRPAHHVSGREATISLEIKIHPHREANAIVINYPGYNGSIDGYSRKYEKIANFIVKNDVAAVVRMGNEDRLGFLYEESLIDDLRAVIDHILLHAADICATANPEIYLMGFSAGAGAIAAVAADYPSVKKILLIAPAGDASNENVSNLARFSGEVYVVIGQWDEVVGVNAGTIFIDMANATSQKKLITIPYCDHQFRGTHNGMVLSKAPLWAFAGDTTFPASRGGIILYN